MSKDILDNLFGSRVRVRVLKFLFRNYPGDFGLGEISKKIGASGTATKKELESLTRLNLLKKSRGDIRYALNPNFEFFPELKSLILKSSPAEKNSMIKKINGLGRIRLAVISGIFMNESENVESSESAVADLFIVGDYINKNKLRNFLRSLEAEAGREIKLSIMDKEEFEYRYGMFDRFVRVLLEGPHEKIINKLGL